MKAEINILSGVKADAVIYLGPPETLVQSPAEPSIYMDLAYFKELDQRARCCMPFGKPLDWQGLVEQESQAPRQYTIQ